MAMRSILFLLAAALAAATPAHAAPFDVGHHTSAGLGPVNSWWIETPGGGLIVFDAQRDPASADAAIAAIRATKLAVRAIVLTHPHPDHTPGLARFATAFPDAPVIAQAATAEELRDDTQKLFATEPRPPAPTRIVGDAPFTIDGLVIEPRAMGAGESVAQTVYWLPQARMLVSADLATPGLVPFLAEGRTGAWLTALDRLAAAYPSARALPGHGRAGELGTLVAAQRRYLLAYREAIRAAIAGTSAGGTVVTPAERAALVEQMKAAFGTRAQVAGLPSAELDKLNAKAVARELATTP